MFILWPNRLRNYLSYPLYIWAYFQQDRLYVLKFYVNFLSLAERTATKTRAHLLSAPEDMLISPYLKTEKLGTCATVISKRLGQVSATYGPKAGSREPPKIIQPTHSSAEGKASIQLAMLLNRVDTQYRDPVSLRRWFSHALPSM